MKLLIHLHDNHSWLGQVRVRSGCVLFSSLVCHWALLNLPLMKLVFHL